MFGKPKLTKIFLDHPREALPVQIVGDGAISNGGVADGRMLPVLILDADARPDIREFTKLHRHGVSGDVKVQWGQVPDYKDTIFLILTFLRPVEMKIMVAFDLHRQQGSLVEQILAMQGLYIQAGSEGDRLKNTMDEPRVLVEIPDTGFRKIWDKLYFLFTVKRLRADGLDRKQAKALAHEFISDLRKLGQFRMPSR